MASMVKEYKEGARVVGLSLWVGTLFGGKQPFHRGHQKAQIFTLWFIIAKS